MTGPVSGPGPYSRRSDQQPIREPGGLPYGDNKDLREQQQAAPMAQSESLPRPQIVPLGAPSTRPGQPVTAGADAGPGPGSAVLAAPTPEGSPLVNALLAATSVDPSGILSGLLVEAMKRGL